MNALLKSTLALTQRVLAAPGLKNSLTPDAGLKAAIESALEQIERHSAGHTGVTSLIKQVREVIRK
jgi:hypothetical protein